MKLYLKWKRLSMQRLFQTWKKFELSMVWERENFVREYTSICVRKETLRSIASVNMGKAKQGSRS